MISLIRYNDSYENVWNKFNDESKNSIFMFDRKYMNYHKDRFKDHSLIFFNNDKILALLPMCEIDKTLYSHAGLTYGGFITDNNMKQHYMNECFELLIRYAKENNFENIIYKSIPHIFHKQAAEEEKYSLFVNNAKIKKIAASTYLNLQNPIKMSKGRKAQISRGKREKVIVKELSRKDDFIGFINLENEVLGQYHNTKAVHTGEELKYLHDKFPNEIHLFCAFVESELIAGSVIYEYENVIHTQYLAANDKARKIGALDVVINYIIEKYGDLKQWMDFGTSNEPGKIVINDGLISQKESFGGRTGVYEIWEINL